jgi:Zn-dependent protease with chaperone function
MSMGKVLAGAIAGTMCLALPSAGWAQLFTRDETMSDLIVQVSMDTSGGATIEAWSRNGGKELAYLLPKVIDCHSGVKAEEFPGSSIHCRRALRKDGLTLEGVIDLAPIAQKLNGSAGIQLFVNYPRLGFESASVPMSDGGNVLHVNRKARFAAGVIPAPITFRFGYRPNQLAGIYLPLLASALGLLLIAAFLSRTGYASLAFSAIMLGTMGWMAAAAQLQADTLLSILLFPTPLAGIATLFVDMWPPLICVAIGTALGSRMRRERLRKRTFGEVFSAFAIIPLIITCAVGAMNAVSEDGWTAVAGWVVLAPAFLLCRRAWNRTRARSSIRQLTAGELKERISALAARAGHPQIKAYVSFSTNSQVANAFALPGRTIFLTAPLIRLLSKREVDAVAAHELSHMRHSNRGAWTALCIAMVICATPARELVYQLPGGLAVAMIVPVALYFIALRGMRKREFAADAGAAALTADPRAMVSSLARISRNNDTPLHFNAVAERFASHPSTLKRIRALAAAARLDAAEVETLCAGGDPGEHYEIPPEDHTPEIFNLAWQKSNAGMYGWFVIFGSCATGLLMAWLIQEFIGYGIISALSGIVIGCVLIKGAAAASMASRYGRLRRKLMAKLGVRGQLVGLAPNGEALIYNGYRFSDAGLLRFENGLLHYQSERIAIALNPADVVEVGLVAAAPSNWFRRQPMVRFRNPESGQTHAFILHTVDWLATQRRLLRSIQHWRATGTSPEGSSIKGFDPVSGQLFSAPSLAQVARGLLITEAIALTAASIAICSILPFDWRYLAYTLAVTACAYASMMLPAMLNRRPLPVAELPSQAETN